MGRRGRRAACLYLYYEKQERIDQTPKSKSNTDEPKTHNNAHMHSSFPLYYFWLSLLLPTEFTAPTLYATRLFRLGKIWFGHCSKLEGI